MLKVFDTWREKRNQRAAYRQLSGLGANLLADIGLTRDDLEDLRRGRHRNTSMPR
jgi:uncharacterized protein YjiS (DUF1127 family)